MAKQEEDFLKDQVTRLSVLLTGYQEAYPNFAIEEFGISEAPSDGTPSWISNSKELTPLLREYDTTIYGLETQLQRLQAETITLKSQARGLVEENESLRAELIETVKMRLPGGEDDIGDDALIGNLQQQIDLAVTEKESAQEKWRESAQEVDRLEAELEMEKDSHQWRVVEKQAHQVKDQYQQSVAVLNTEVETLQAELRESRNENGMMNQKIQELKINANDLQQQLIWKDQENADKIFKEGISDSKIVELKRIMDDLRLRLSSLSRESDELRRENTSLHARLAELQRRLADTEKRENDAISQVRDAVQVVEAAVMEKDQMEVLAHQKEEELEEVRGVMTKVINKAGARTREEVDTVRKQCNDRIAQLTEELHALEMGSAEKQSRLDRLLREKRAVESELQQIYKEGMVEGSKAKEAYQELNKRAIDAERARDESSMKIETMQGEIDKLTLDNNQLKDQLATNSKQLKEQLTSIQSEFDTVNEDRVTFMNKLNEMDKKLLAAKQEKEGAHRKFMKELALIEQEQHMKTRDFEVKLQTAEDTRLQTVSELRRLLTAQQRMSARWKEECQTITHKFEGKIEDLRGELAHVKKRNEELTSLLKDSQAKTSEVERMMVEYTKNIRRMEERVREAENQAGEASKKLSRQSIREKQMANERESLLSELAYSQSQNRTTPGSLGFPSGKGDVPFEMSQRDELTLDQLSSSRKIQPSLNGTGGR